VRNLTLILVIILILFCPLCIAGSTFSDKGEELLTECEKAISSRRFNLLERKAEELRRIGLSQGNRDETVTGEALKLYSLICVRDTSDFTLRIEALIKNSEEMKRKNMRSYAVLSRTLSSYYQRIINDYSQALYYASEYLDATRKTGDRRGEASALASISSIYFQKQDPSGWAYAVESYELAKEIGDLSIRYVTSCNMANYLFNNMKADEAMRYLKEAADFAKRARLESEESYINSFFGDIYSRLGQPQEAERYYLLSLEDKSGTSAYDKVYSQICYAIFLLDSKRLNEALSRLTTASEMARHYKVIIFEKEIYSLMSRIYEEQGDYVRSLEYYKKYNNTTLKLFSEQKEREFAILHLRNKVSEEERKNVVQNLELVKRGRTIIVLIAVGIMFLLICIALYIYHRRKVADYKQTVARYLDNARSERILREQLQAAIARKHEQRYGGLNDEKSSQLFMALEKMMKEEMIYRDSALSLEKTAGLLSTNRTYLSRVVNEISGKSFSNYVNEYRLKEAVEILSDLDNSDSLKSIGTRVGFTSPSNFYTLFRQKVGVSPSIFRSNVKNLGNSIQNNQNDILNSQFTN